MLGNMTPGKVLAFLFFLTAGLSAFSASAEPWQKIFVHAGETKTIPVPPGKQIEFLPIFGTANSGMSVKLDYGGDNVIPPVGAGNSVVSPPTTIVGPVTISLIMSKTAPFTTAASFLVITYRLKDNL